MDSDGSARHCLRRAVTTQRHPQLFMYACFYSCQWPTFGLARIGCQRVPAQSCPATCRASRAVLDAQRQCAGGRFSAKWMLLSSGYGSSTGASPTPLWRRSSLNSRRASVPKAAAEAHASLSQPIPARQLVHGRSRSAEGSAYCIMCHISGVLQ